MDFNLNSVLTFVISALAAIGVISSICFMFDGACDQNEYKIGSVVVFNHEDGQKDFGIVIRIHKTITSSFDGTETWYKYSILSNQMKIPLFLVPEADEVYEVNENEVLSDFVLTDAVTMFRKKQSV